MHARTGMLQVPPDNLDRVVSQVQSEQIPQYRQQPGYKGFTVLANRQSGEVIGVSFWETQDDLNTAEELGEKARTQAAETGQAGSEPEVGRWEVLLDDMV
jgi:heme-degrading monooxygenase HmoA